MMRRHVLMLLALCGTLAAEPDAGPKAFYDAFGGLRALSLQGELLHVTSDVRVPGRNWQKVATTVPWCASNITHTASASDEVWKTRLTLDPGQDFDLTQSAREDGDAVRMDISVTALADVETEGVFLFVRLPAPGFTNGHVRLVLDNDTTGLVRLPCTTPPASRHFLCADADTIFIGDPLGRMRIRLTLSRPCPIAVQDDRAWNEDTFSLFLPITTNALQRGQTASITIRVDLRGTPDRTPALLRLDAARACGRLEGFGGNYCFLTESPATAFTLGTLTTAWARTQMSLQEWEPVNDNDSPTNADWSRLEASDQPESPIRREMLMARDIQRRGLPFCASVWYLPAWMYDLPELGKDAFGHKIAADKWPEMLECVETYLLYAKRKYGVEPDLFSFNEPEIGVHVLLLSDEYVRMVQDLGERFRSLGLKTRILLGDTASPRSISYVDAVVTNPAAMSNIAALAFHSWSTSDPEDYRPWRDLADQLSLPLFCTEVGTDPEAWHNPWVFDSLAYAIVELRMYQELLQHACPQALLQWEFTKDYGLVTEAGRDVVPTIRYWFIKQFCNLTPRGARSLFTDSSHPDVLLTAFEGVAPGGAVPKAVYTLHVANLGAARDATLVGIPPDVTELYPVLTDRTRSFAALPPVKVARGSCELPLPALSLLTLTSRPPAP